MGGFVIIVGVILMVVIHEGAHFVAAKAFGMKATEAFFGFGPRLWSMRRGETEYGIKAIPLGGYVRIIGMNPFEEVDAEDEHRTYRQKPFGQKAIVVLAGISSHFVIAFALFWVVAVVWGTAILPVPELSPTVTNVGRVVIESDETDNAVPLQLERDDVVLAIDGVPLEQLTPSSYEDPGQLVELTIDRSGEQVAVATTDRVVPTPAFLAGALEGDRIVRVDSEVISSWDDFIEAARSRPNQETAVFVERDGREIALTATLTTRIVDGDEVGFFGVAPSDTVNVFRALRVSGGNVVRSTTAAADGLADLVLNFGGILSATVTNNDAVLDQSRPISVIGLVRLAGPLESSLVLLAFVNVFVGVLNVVPLYPLDGGHFAVAAYEKIRGRPADVRKLLPVAAAVFFFVVLLGLLGIYLDIFNPLEVPGQ